MIALRVVAPFLGCAVIVAVAAPVIAGDQGIDRLFFTPERRQQLDRQRELNVPDGQPVRVDPTLTIDGVVTRSSGRRTTWINGVAQDERDAFSGVTVSPRPGDPGKVVVRMSDSPAARARVGETVNASTGEAIDLLNGGSIGVHGGARGAP
ncbi:hypothetical protein [Accumulibacter sp.]|uniref:hypothetical protein n=1 Tax=Accumulibacter sp. TaxID=2053492 RepID=UPI0026011BB0|nr:hypothetical protein [Accumulibacter sp.]MCM8594720.1 hypothetical protein [Accumulibacter sp.]MCM8625864.1 hypothetical protein [Accumulibacter sp.]MDS4048866.1 hypothetical protein [Accumulibacter sp.]